MSDALLVGYLESWQSTDRPAITFTQAAQNGYTAIVMAFGSIDGTTISIAGGNFFPSPTPQALKDDIQNAKNNGAKQILFSVGGETDHNTYKPGSASSADLAQALVAYLREYGFTGVDFDLEIDTDGVYLDQLCAAIKALAPELLITAAPQLNQGPPESSLMLVTSGTSQCYDIAVKNQRFDYLFIQCYNNGWPTVNGSKETDVAFISNGFKNLKQTIPATTKIAMGEPATVDGAGTYSVYHGPDKGPGIYALMAAQYNLIKADPQYGGAMVWDINLDAKNNYQFAAAMKQ